MIGLIQWLLVLSGNIEVSSRGKPEIKPAIKWSGCDSSLPTTSIYLPITHEIMA